MLTNTKKSLLFIAFVFLFSAINFFQLRFLVVGYRDTYDGRCRKLPTWYNQQLVKEGYLGSSCSNGYELGIGYPRYFIAQGPGDIMNKDYSMFAESSFGRWNYPALAINLAWIFALSILGTWIFDKRKRIVDSRPKT